MEFTSQSFFNYCQKRGAMWPKVCTKLPDKLKGLPILLNTNIQI